MRFTGAFIWLLRIYLVYHGIGGLAHCAAWSFKTTPKHQPQPATSRHHLELLSWVVSVHHDARRDSRRRVDAVAAGVAREAGLVNHGQIGSLRGLYQLDHNLHHHHFSANVLVTQDSQSTREHARQVGLPEHWSVKRLNSTEWAAHVERVRERLEEHPDVEWFTQLHAFRRKTRALVFKDPAFPKQWHLKNRNRIGHDLNITRVWERNITGKGVVTAVVDDGLEWTNPDISPNYFPDASYDLNDYDRDPMPSEKDSKNHHGTRCAGEIAAAANNVCAVGVAYESKIAGLKVLDGPMTDSLEGVAFTKAKDLIDVYSCSWGPDDDGKTVDGPHYIASRALREAVDYGRKGYGSVFVVASGNGGMVGDNCNFDGYANSIYTVTIGAVDEMGSMPYYAEECASMLAVTYSSGSGGMRSIVTTDWHKAGGTGCTTGHSGTSAAAPLATGMIALMLQARPCLTWRDVQHVIVMAAVKVDVAVAHWTQNKAGLHHSHKHGFGLLDAWRLVNAAKTWRPVPWMTIYSTTELVENQPIPGHTQMLQLTYTVTPEMLEGYNLFTLEYVHAIVTLEHARRGSLEIRLQCPSLTGSVLAATRQVDDSTEGFDQWTFSTVRCWGEPPEGDWVLTVQDTEKNAMASRGVFKKWQLKLYGSAMSPEDVANRRRSVKEAASGEKLYDNITLPCPPPPLRNKPVSVISQKNLKILVLVSAFCLVMAVYETFEYMFCYDEEKKKHKEEMAAEARRRNAETQPPNTTSPAPGNTSADDIQETPNPEDANEVTRLLTSEGAIPMETLSPNGGLPNGSSVCDMAPMINEERTPCLREAGRTVNERFADKVQRLMSRLFRREAHRYVTLSDSDKTPLTDDVSDDVTFDVADERGVMNEPQCWEGGGSDRPSGSYSSLPSVDPAPLPYCEDARSLAQPIAAANLGLITNRRNVTTPDLSSGVQNGVAHVNGIGTSVSNI